MTSDEELLLHLKTAGPLSAGSLARRLGVTPQGLRRRLESLRAEGFVESRELRDAGTAAPGRPAQVWTLSPAGDARFPDGHDQLAVELISGIRETLGEAALDVLIAGRERQQDRRYRQALKDRQSLADRLDALARLRSAEGYMAAAERQADGSFLLIEHHCPICAAAKACQGFCRSELQIFRAVLGSDISVEREQHLLSGDRRCVYRVRERI